MTSQRRPNLTRRLWVALALIGALWIALGFTVPGRANAGTYCNIWVPGNTDCANVPGGSWSNGYFDQNEGIDINNFDVCEHTYIYGTGTTVSRHCGGNPQSAGWDLMCYYVEGRELSGHVGNDNPFQQPMEGYTYIEAVHCV